MENTIVKKFYKNFSEEEVEYLSELLDDMSSADIEFPQHVIKRMIDRRILPKAAINAVNPGYYEDSYAGFQDVIITMESGEPYEVSNEALNKTPNPFRIVLAKEFDDGRYTLFVKIAPFRNLEEVKILDVWQRHGKLPQTPPPHARDQFCEGWDFIADFELLFRTISLNNNHIRDMQDDGENDIGIRPLIQV